MKKSLALLALILVLAISPVQSFAAPFTVNLVGKWQGTFSGVNYDPGSASFQYYTGTITIRILDQQGDRFYGEESSDGKPYNKFTGVISEGKGLVSSPNTVVTIGMPFLEDGKWRMAGHVQHSESSGFMNTEKFTVHRVSTTP